MFGIFRMIEIKFSQPYFQPNFPNKNNLSSKNGKKYTNLITSLKIINEVMRLVWGEPIGY
jgi:hypothetical protein